MFSNVLAGVLSGGLLPLVGVVRARKTPQAFKVCGVGTLAVLIFSPDTLSASFAYKYKRPVILLISTVFSRYMNCSGGLCFVDLRGLLAIYIYIYIGFPAIYMYVYI
jgi:hypothetical protein